MPDYIISHRRAGKRQDHEHRHAREAMHAALEKHVASIGDLLHASEPGHDTARHVAAFRADPEEVRRRDWHPDLIVEPRIEHHIGRARQPDTGRAQAHEHAATAGNGQALHVRVTTRDGRPLPDVDVFAYIGEGSGHRQVVGVTDADGRVVLEHDSGATVSELAVAPAHSWWPAVQAHPGDDLHFRLERLPSSRDGTGWWHQQAGLAGYDPARGAGLRVGVIDTGLGTHPALVHIADLGAIVDSRHDPDAGTDQRGHGTHVCGALGARITDPAGYGGLAPGAAIDSVRVFGDSDSAHQGDIALALYLLGHQRGCHLVNLSLGTAECSQLVADAIADAYAHGCLTLCAAGNTNCEVEYPAALDEAVAVTALGRLDWGPPGSLAEHRIPEEPARRADPLYIADFCCHGAAIDATAPGVGIISTVPGGYYAAYGGTSMAAPQVTGVLAVALAEDPDYTGLHADESRARHARKVLNGLCRDLGLAPIYQGRGRVAVK